MSYTNKLDCKKSITFDPDKGFLELPIVRWALTALSGLCLALIALIVLTEHRSFQLDAQGLSNFASLFRIPIGAFTLSLPVFALLATNHRSEQTKQQMALTRNQIERTDRQIQIAGDQSKFTNYYKHLEEFAKYCEAHFKGKGFVVKLPRKLHFAMYPAARQGDLSISQNFLQTFDNDVSDLHSLLRLLATPEKRDHVLARTARDGEELISKYFLERGIPTGGSNLSFNGATIFIPGSKLSSFISYQLQIIQTVDEVLAFDTAYVASPSVRRMLEFSKLFGRKGDISLAGQFDFDEIDQQALMNI